MNELSPERHSHSVWTCSMPNGTVTRDQIEQCISQNQEIADISLLREEILKRLPRLSEAPLTVPVALHLQKRTERLRPFVPFLRGLLDPNSVSPRLRSLVCNIKLATALGWKPEAFRQVPSVFDQRFSDPNDFIEPIFSAIFQDRDAGLLRQWMGVLDAHVGASSRHILEAIDRRAWQQQTPLFRDVVLVGGGPLTSLVASILGAFCHITVITEQRGLGKPWRNRPIFINSSSLIKDFNGAPLPLLGGSTTRIIGRQQLNNLDIDLLLGFDTKAIRCENGSITEYVAGPRMGDLIATNIVFNADDYLIQQQVDVSQIERNTDGSIHLALVDTEDGTRRVLNASAVFLLTGPGKERSSVANRASQQLYHDATKQLDASLREARWKLLWHREALQRLETQPSTPGVRVQCQWVRQRMAQTTIALPRVLTLTALEKLYEYWGDLGSDPAAFPLTHLLNAKALASIGNGDTARTLKELVDACGPMRAYPVGFEKNSSTKSTIYNESASSAQEYDRSNRRRYQGTYTLATTAIPFKASQYRWKPDQQKVEVTHRDEQGRRRRRRYDYVFDCTGLERFPIEATLPATFSLQDIRDLQGVVVARGNAEATLFIAGTATNWKAPDFPEKIQQIIRALGIAENTLSLWVHGLLAERMAYTYLVTRQPANGRGS